jgi:hypothetical protein
MKRIIFIVFLIILTLIISGCSSDPCKQKVKFSGNCKMSIISYEFDANSGMCVEKRGGGCKGSSPFKSLEECKKACEIK